MPAQQAQMSCLEDLVWTKTADEILKKANRQTTSNTRHQDDYG